MPDPQTTLDELPVLPAPWRYRKVIIHLLNEETKVVKTISKMDVDPVTCARWAIAKIRWAT